MWKGNPPYNTIGKLNNKIDLAKEILQGLFLRQKAYKNTQKQAFLTVTPKNMHFSALFSDLVWKIRIFCAFSGMINAFVFFVIKGIAREHSMLWVLYFLGVSKVQKTWETLYKFFYKIPLYFGSYVI